jgi:hypothetical protein
MHADGLAAAARQEALAEVGFLSALDDVGRLDALQAVVSPGYRRLAQTATRAGAGLPRAGVGVGVGSA